MNPVLVGLIAMGVMVGVFGYLFVVYTIADTLSEEHGDDFRWFLGTTVVGVVLLVGIGAVVVAATS